MTSSGTPTVQTATGPIPVAELGRTLMHEHIFPFHSDMAADYPWEDEERFVTGAVEKLVRLKAAGFDSLVDVTAIGLGRDVRRVARVAEASGVHIVVATGVYARAEMPGYFRLHLPLEGPAFIEDFFVREIEDGIGRTGIRAGILKCVIDAPGLTDDVELLIRSTARAQRRTDVPLATHSLPSTESGLVQVRLFREEGVDLDRVIIGHSDETTDLDYLQRLLDSGVYLGMDRFGNYRVVTLEEKVATVAALCARGYAPRIVLSHDANVGGDVLAEYSFSTWRFGHISEVVIPALLASGVSQEDIDIMTRDNPRALFTSGVPGTKD